MIPVSTFSGKRVAVFGLGGSGRATAAALVAGGALVSAWDDKPDAVAASASAGIPTENLALVNWRGFAALVLTPGVPLTHPGPHWTVLRAQAAGIEVIGDIELFCRERRAHVPAAPFIAITGTNGKSTTTALIAHLLEQADRDVQLGGNIGTAILSLDPPRTGRFHVVECSSFQIDLAPSINPSVGVLLNVTPDHLDRHGTFDRYAKIKERLVAQSTSSVIVVDDDWCRTVADRLERSGRRVTRVSARRPLAEGVYARDGHIYSVTSGASVEIARLDGIGSLRGAHNAENAAAAVATVKKFGLDDRTIAAGLRTFPGLPHRMEEVGRRGRVLFVNDSKATNADAAAKALASFARIYWIAGGRPKEGGIAGLAEFFPKIARAYLIGEAAEDFAATLGETVPHEMSGTLAAALAAASRDSAGERAEEAVVLLSPACASYDQFQNFERRGDAFRTLVLQLDGITSRGGRLMVSRANRSQFAEWWWTVDKYMMCGLLALMLGGVILSLAGSPPVAERLGYDSFHFFQRHVAFLVPALVVMIATSFLSPRLARRTALIVLVVAIVLMLATLFLGTEVKGARRWVTFLGMTLQPSEFMKPAFVVVVAWLFAENARRPEIPGNVFALILLGIVVALLVAEPDFGQTMLISIAWGALFFMAGVPWLWIMGLGAAAVGGIFAAYSTLPHVAGRIDRFISPQSGDTFQIDKALDSVLSGGWFGAGPGEGVVKRILPDAHTDFIFAVAAEEFGIIICIGLVIIFALVVFRGFESSLKSDDPFIRLASAGLVVLFGVQSVINMAVNLDMMPAKGMTLPFISYGGSSMVAVAFGMGLLLALTRRRPEPRKVATTLAPADPPAPVAA